VKFEDVVAVPADVVTLIGPLVVPAFTFTTICVSELDWIFCFVPPMVT
jgi:hypothetical protein